MAYKSKTLRKLPTTSRKTARLINELDSITTRLKHLLPEITDLEHESRAFYNMKKHQEAEENKVSEVIFKELEEQNKTE